MVKGDDKLFVIIFLSIIVEFKLTVELMIVKDFLVNTQVVIHFLKQ